MHLTHQLVTQSYNIIIMCLVSPCTACARVWAMCMGMVHRVKWSTAINVFGYTVHDYYYYYWIAILSVLFTPIWIWLEMYRISNREYETSLMCTSHYYLFVRCQINWDGCSGSSSRSSRVWTYATVEFNKPINWIKLDWFFVGSARFRPSSRVRFYKYISIRHSAIGTECELLIQRNILLNQRKYHFEWMFRNIQKSSCSYDGAQCPMTNSGGVAFLNRFHFPYE